MRRAAYQYLAKTARPAGVAGHRPQALPFALPLALPLILPLSSARGDNTVVLGDSTNRPSKAKKRG